MSESSKFIFWISAFNSSNRISIPKAQLFAVAFTVPNYLPRAVGNFFFIGLVFLASLKLIWLKIILRINNNFFYNNNIKERKLKL